MANTRQVVELDMGLYIIETDDTGTRVRLGEDWDFEGDDFDLDDTYFITNKDNNKVCAEMTKRLGYDWQDQYGIDYVDDITTDHEELYDIAHEAIKDVLENKIIRYFEEQIIEARGNKDE